jgi:hypothetical protein
MVFLWCAGCASAGNQLAKQASIDLGCSRRGLDLYKVNNRTYQVSGCGYSVTYESTCAGRHDPNHCEWVMSDKQAPAQTEAPAIVPTAHEESDARIETARGEDGSTKLKLYMSSYDWTLYFAATPRTDGKLATVVWRIPKTYPNQQCEIKLAGDGVRVELGATTDRIERNRSYDYQTTMPYASLLSLAKSSRIAGRLCGVEATLTDTQIARLRELVVRIREEHAWDEEPERTAEEAEVAPTEL